MTTFEAWATNTTVAWTALGKSYAHLAHFSEDLTSSTPIHNIASK